MAAVVSRRCLHLALLAKLGVAALCAEQLPVKTYTMADGLARDRVDCNRPGRARFLWFCTTGGLSRFDGYTFTNYGPEVGLPKLDVTP
jgi:hypothetical protein